jgi:hypothetical protein
MSALSPDFGLHHRFARSLESRQDSLNSRTSGSGKKRERAGADWSRAAAGAGADWGKSGSKADKIEGKAEQLSQKLVLTVLITIMRLCNLPGVILQSPISEPT